MWVSNLHACGWTCWLKNSFLSKSKPQKYSRLGLNWVELKFSMINILIYPSFDVLVQKGDRRYQITQLRTSEEIILRNLTVISPFCGGEISKFGISTIDRVNNSDLLQQCIEVMTYWWCPSSYNSISLHFPVESQPAVGFWCNLLTHNMSYYSARQPKSNCFHDKSCPHLRLHITVGTVIL